jgi:hypothetical protein
VSFFDTDDCSGDPSSVFDTPPSAEVDQWVVVQAGNISAVTTGSASVALLGLRPKGGGLDLYFDNVMLKAQEP